MSTFSIQSLTDIDSLVLSEEINQGFDEAMYAEAKPHFLAALQAFKEAGLDLGTFLSWACDSFGSGIRPHLKRFEQELSDSNQGETK